MNVGRPPGWKLIATVNGPHGWHLVDHTTEHQAVVTRCGITGRVITEHERQIETCGPCAEATTR